MFWEDVAGAGDTSIEHALFSLSFRLINSVSIFRTSNDKMSWTFFRFACLSSSLSSPISCRNYEIQIFLTVNVCTQRIHRNLFQSQRLKCFETYLIYFWSRHCARFLCFQKQWKRRIHMQSNRLINWEMGIKIQFCTVWFSATPKQQNEDLTDHY